ncbi:hypothetical protein PORY_000923 [Pneumocystis oryctolagi]|uniref:Uncharacterized protein n=1 Tax=Pneumocystis oryctolagi TaxID=42067 RepID=A0ACB7CFS3_9ASCO|nr:hypothetical protein PORY_000923 [Pneumocystis oryctolagi]
MADDVKALVESILSNNKVVVFSKSYCPHCDKTKSLLDSLNAKYHVLELDQRGDGKNIQQYLLELTGQATVPNIFISRQHIGGNSDLEALQNSGKLEERLRNE